MVASPVSLLRAVLDRAVVPVRRRVRPFLHQTEGPEDPLLYQVLGLLAGLVGFAVYAAVALVGVLLVTLYALVYPVLRLGERVVERVRGWLGGFRRSGR